jgi:D-glycero-D-manno-heptose 1,7-bisphosphate phosphatase
VLKKLILFDRDGTLNKRIRNGYLLDVSQITYPNDYSSLDWLSADSYEVGIVTNQACVSRNLISIEVVHELTLEIARRLFINFTPGLFICPHSDADRCQCRKPNPGLIYSALEFFKIGPEDCFMVGDSPQDREASITAGVRFIGVCWDGECLGDDCAHTLANVIQCILSEGKE